MTVRYPTQCEIARLFPINCAARLSKIVNCRFQQRRKFSSPDMQSKLLFSLRVRIASSDDSNSRKQTIYPGVSSFGGDTGTVTRTIVLPMCLSGHKREFTKTGVSAITQTVLRCATHHSAKQSTPRRGRRPALCVHAIVIRAPPH